MALRRAKLRATTAHMVCPHCGGVRRAPGSAMVEYTCDEVLDILAGAESVTAECQHCYKRYSLWAGTVDRVWSPL